MPLVTQQPPRQLRYISLFSGGFGLDLGLEQASTQDFCFSPAVCVEIDTFARTTILKNRPQIHVIGNEKGDHGGDLHKLSTARILAHAGLRIGEVDLVVGGPPCQSNSILGKRKGLADKRGTLMLKFVRIVNEARPRVFVMENVEGFLTVNGGTDYQEVLKSFKHRYYPHIQTWRLNALDFGVPQDRSRVFLVGFRADVCWRRWIAPPTATHRPRGSEENYSDHRPSYRYVEDVLRDIPEDLPNSERRVHGNKVRDRYTQVPPGGRDRVDHTDRLRWDAPSGTVLVGSSQGGGRPFIHPEEPRHLTVREAARLQAFPDDWVFNGTQTAQYRQVGNAVPPPLARAVSLHIASFLCTKSIRRLEQSVEKPQISASCLL